MRRKLFVLAIGAAWWGSLLGVDAESADQSQPVTTSVRQVRLPATPYNYREVTLPSHFTRVAEFFDNTPHDNPLTDEGATLGRVLFYDQTLSANKTTACATCHQQQQAFTDDKRLSIGFAGKHVARNSMSLVNVRYYLRGKMFWDERADTLEAQVLMPIENEIEMGHQLPALVKQLQADPLYPPLFEKAFGDERVTQSRISRALAQFLRAIVSFRSRYDLGRQQVSDVLEPFPNFTAQENYGKAQFFGRANCASCHLEPHPKRTDVRQTAFFFLIRPAVNGIDSDEPDRDRGVGEVTGNKTEIGKFKVPSLRNVEVTGPYMHDGRFHTLDQVVEHYNWSVRPHPNLDDRLTDFAANGLALPEREKVALTQFLRTLTDQALLHDPKFSDPFQSE